MYQIFHYDRQTGMTARAELDETLIGYGRPWGSASVTPARGSTRAQQPLRLQAAAT